MIGHSEDSLKLLGFTLSKGSVHNARTMMLNELQILLSKVGLQASKEDYMRAIVEDNCLGKKSLINRKLTAVFLAYLYGLDSSTALFRTLTYFWQRDPEAQPLLALICSYCRDTILQEATPFYFQYRPGERVNRRLLEDYLERSHPGRFSKATLTSTAQNLNSSFTQSGHLAGRAIKTRKKANATPGAVAFALFAGYLAGSRGQTLFHNELIRLLDCPPEQAVSLAQEAARRGWIVFKQAGNIIEVLFPGLLSEADQELIHEQA